MSRQIRTFGIPDLPRMAAALGIGRWLTPPAKFITSRLDYLADCVRYRVCPDLKGERHVENGRVSYDPVPLPKELEPHRQDLGTGVMECRRLLDTGDLDAARERLKRIDWLVESMKARAAEPAHQLERDTLKRQQKGGRNRKGKLKKTTKKAVELLSIGRNIKQVAAELHMTDDAVRKTHQRYRNEIRK